MSTFKFFVSYKAEDEEIASAFADTISDLAADLRTSDSLAIEMARDIPHGESWHTDIHKSLSSTDTFFLLYTGPSDDWTWCTYEAGVFKGLCMAGEESARERLLCVLLYPNDPLPGPLQGTQSIPAKASRVVKMLERAFGKALAEREDALAAKQRLSSEKKAQAFKGAAERIVTLMADGHRTEFAPTQRVLLTLSPNEVNGLKNERKIPAAARVVAPDGLLATWGIPSDESATFRGIFGTTVCKSDPASFNAWHEALVDVLLQVDRGDPPKASLPMLRLDQGAYVRSAVFRVWTERSGLISIEIAFYKAAPYEIGEPNQNTDLDYYAAMVEIGQKFRWGVYQPLLNCARQLLAQGAPSKHDVDTLLAIPLRQGLNAGYAEAARLNLFDRGLALSKLSGRARGEMQSIFSDWDDTSHKFVEEATVSRDAVRIKDALEKLLEINRRYLLLGLQAFSQELKRASPDAVPSSVKKKAKSGK